MKRFTTKHFAWVAVAATLALAQGTALAQYTNFEGHQLHPLDITPDGSKLLAVNTPDARLSIFSIGVAGDLTLVTEVPVGVEPVSVRARTNTEAWVVNHVSDSISIVDLTSGQERVRQTLSVRTSPPAASCTGLGAPFDCCTGSGTAKHCAGDEPTDVVFAGGGGDPRAFVCLSQRNRVDVFSASAPTTPLFFIPIDGEDPRALARNAAGTEVYAAVFQSGNQTTLVSGEACGTAPTCTVPNSRVTNSSSPYSGQKVPPPAANAFCTASGQPFPCCTGVRTGTCPAYNAGASPFNDRPFTSVIVKWRDCTGNTLPEWCDDNNSSWNNFLDSTVGSAGGGTVMEMRDRDVAIIDADAGAPSVTGYVQSAGTLNFGIAVNPSSQRLYVSNTDALNHMRFESGVEAIGDGQGDDDGICEGAEPCTVSLNGHLVDTRITVATGTTISGSVNLNPHINYNADIATIDKTQSIGQPNGMAFNSAGTRLYAAAILSRKVVVLDTSAVPGSVLARVDVGQGPTGVALKESANRLYVLNRHDNTISMVNTSTNAEVLPRASLYNPEPAVLRQGRTFLYDAQLTSGRGDVACATCHAFNDMDLLAWDLGDPTDTFPYDARPSQSPAGVAVECSNNPNQAGCGPFHPLKGPQTTQTLRGLKDNSECTGAGAPFACCTGAGTGNCGDVRPLHWRGDRASFEAFNKAFPGLLKNPSKLSLGADCTGAGTPFACCTGVGTGQCDMDDYTDFIFTVAFPPNPNRNLDDTLTSGAQSGQNEFMAVPRDNDQFNCNQCHALPTGTNGRFINALADQVQQAVKTPHLRNMYEKTGFELHPDPNPNVSCVAAGIPFSCCTGFGTGTCPGAPTFTRNGFGFVHDGAVDNQVTFHGNLIFTFLRPPSPNMPALLNMVDFMMEFPTGQAATVGHSITFNGANNGDATLNAQLNSLFQVLNLGGKIDLIVRGVFGGIPRNFRCTTVSPTQASCQPDRAGESAIDAATLKGLAASGSELTFLAVPVGFGQRMGLDRDGDGYRDQDEIDAGSNPADPEDTPGGAPAIPTISGWGTLLLVALLALLSRRRLRS